MKPPSPTKQIVFPGGSVRIGAWCPRFHGELMDCDRECEKCAWKWQEVLGV